jgi:kumamolisin
VNITKYAVCVIALAATFPANLTASASADAKFGAIPVQPGPAIGARGRILIPESSAEKPGDIGRRAHTNHRIFVPNGEAGPSISPNTTFGENPASIACVYRLVTQKQGCNPAVVTALSKGGGKIIAIVDAFHNPSAVSDLRAFSSKFGIGAPNIEVVYCSSSACGVSTPPPIDTSWALESALDIESAHAIAPKAKILLVEARSNTYANLLRAVDYAGQRIKAAGGGEVSQSYGGSEFAGETAYDTHFKTKNVVYFASAGDSPGTEYPSTSPLVVAAGGTTINRDANGKLMSESAWVDTGGGLSSVYPRPTYQNGIAGPVGNHRGVPDVAADADPTSGFPVLCSACGGWFQVGGTSLAAPLLAAITNVAAQQSGVFAPSSPAELTAIYADLGATTKLYDVKTGACGFGKADHAVTGWDRCTGVGTPRTAAGLQNDIAPRMVAAEAH